MIKRAAALVALVGLVCVLVPTIGPRSEVSAAQMMIGRVHETFQPKKGKIFFLVIGNDARSGNPDQSRADAVHIVGVNTEKMRAGILNFPRDSWVNAPGLGSSKLTEVLYHGGPKLLAQTLEGLTNIRLDYWVMTGFEGFEGIIKDLGGVRITLPTAVHDYGSGANLDKGEQVLGPSQSLAYTRSRKAFSSGDIARTTNQGRFLMALLRKLHREVDENPTKLLRWIAAAKKHARFNVPAEEQFRLGVLASQLPATRVRSVTVPVSVGAVGAASVVFISPGAHSLYSKLRKNGYL